jgi:hypothetical protein
MFTDDDDYYEDIPTFIYLPLDLQYAPTSRREAVIVTIFVDKSTQALNG